MWRFINSTPVIEVRIRNTLMERSYPSADREILAVVDTGYSGFLFVPKKIFSKLELGKLRTKQKMASLADGRSTQLIGSYGSIEFPSLNLRLDGLIQTHPRASEVLVGMEGIRGLLIELNCCQQILSAENCS